MGNYCYPGNPVPPSDLPNSKEQQIETSFYNLKITLKFGNINSNNEGQGIILPIISKDNLLQVNESLIELNLGSLSLINSLVKTKFDQNKNFCELKVHDGFNYKNVVALLEPKDVRQLGDNLKEIF